jgi:hypothetical protein
LTQEYIVIPGKLANSQRDPESRHFKEFWMPVFTGMTTQTRIFC